MTKPHCRIRKATPADVPCMLQIEIESYRTGRFTEPQFRYLVTRARGRVWLAVGHARVQDRYTPLKGESKTRGRSIERLNACLGFLILLTPRFCTSARIYNIATARHARGRGVATALMNHARDWARAHGYPRLHLEVEARNNAAITFYDRMGFRRGRRLHDYYGKGKHGWRYVLE